MQDNYKEKPIKYYELLDIKNILEDYLQNAESELLKSCYYNALENIKKILEVF